MLDWPGWNWVEKYTHVSDKACMHRFSAALALYITWSRIGHMSSRSHNFVKRIPIRSWLHPSVSLLLLSRLSTICIRLHTHCTAFHNITITKALHYICLKYNDEQTLGIMLRRANTVNILSYYLTYRGIINRRLHLYTFSLIWKYKESLPSILV